MKEKQAVTREYKPRYQKASKKDKKLLPDELVRLTGYHCKSAVRLLNAKPVKQVLLYIDDKQVKIKPERNVPPTEKENVYTQMML